MDQSSNKPRTAAEYREWYLANKPEGVAFGECWCGCRRRVSIASSTRIAHTRFYGEPIRYIRGHSPVKSVYKPGPRYIEEDRGYKTPCWIWQLSTFPSGYGQAHRKSHPCRAHKLYYEQTFGPVPKGKHLHHMCQVLTCVNPYHLEPLSFTEHRRRDEKLKLSIQKARQIRRLYASGQYTQAALARKFGVCINTIAHVVQHKTWRE